MSVVQRGREVIWGVVAESGDTHAAALIVSQGVEKAGGEAKVKDLEGHTVGQVFFDDMDNCDIDVDCESGAALPDRGDDIQIAGYACIVQSATLRWQNEQIKRLNIKATKFALLTEA